MVVVDGQGAPIGVDLDSARAVKTTRPRKMKMVANCGLTSVDGRLSLLWHGSQTGEGQSLAGKERLISSKLFLTLLAPSLH
tara:strand:- start:378 stop:620 length:243 start_codon:yes stop_codon:yes gene_type:complete